MKYTVVITSELPPVALQMLAGEFDVVTHPSEGVRSEDDMMVILAEADGAITLPGDPLSRRVLESNPNLRVVANCAVDCNNVDLDAARELGIIVTNTPGILSPGTSETLTEMARIAAGNVQAVLRGFAPLTPVE